MKTPVLAKAFAVIAAEGTGLESRADAVIAIVRDAGIGDLKTFNTAARAAYKANGWNARAGKPLKGNTATAVPSTVKQYVSQVRAAFRLEVDVAKMASFFALRKAVKAARARRRPQLVAVDKRLEGVRLARPGELMGAPFHDLAVVYSHANRMQKSQLVRDVEKLTARYRPIAAPQLLARAA